MYYNALSEKQFAIEQGFPNVPVIAHYHHKYIVVSNIPDSKVHGANMGPIWGRQDPGGHHVGPMNFAIWDMLYDTTATQICIEICSVQHGMGWSCVGGVVEMYNVVMYYPCILIEVYRLTSLCAINWHDLFPRASNLEIALRKIRGTKA